MPSFVRPQAPAWPPPADPLSVIPDELISESGHINTACVMVLKLEREEEDELEQDEKLELEDEKDEDELEKELEHEELEEEDEKELEQEDELLKEEELLELEHTKNSMLVIWPTPGAWFSVMPVMSPDGKAQFASTVNEPPPDGIGTVATPGVTPRFQVAAGILWFAVILTFNGL